MEFGVRGSELGGVVQPDSISPEGHVHTVRRPNHPQNTQRTQKRENIHGLHRLTQIKGTWRQLVDTRTRSPCCRSDLRPRSPSFRCGRRGPPCSPCELLRRARQTRCARRVTEPRTPTFTRHPTPVFICGLFPLAAFVAFPPSAADISGAPRAGGRGGSRKKCCR